MQILKTGKGVRDSDEESKATLTAFIVDPPDLTLGPRNELALILCLNGIF